MKNLPIAATLAACLMLATNAAAQPAGSTSRLGSDDCALAVKRGEPCELTFRTGDTVEGGVPTASGDDVFVPADSFFGQLIRLRWDFRREILASAEDIP